MIAAPNILLIEDDEDDYVLARELLTEVYGPELKLDWARTWESGRDAFAKGSHDVFLVDYRLGAKTGLELIREAVALGCAAPIILLTGQASDGTGQP